MTVAPERKQVTQLFQLIEQPIEGICSAGRDRSQFVASGLPMRAVTWAGAKRRPRLGLKDPRVGHMPFKPDLSNKIGQKETSRPFPHIGT